MEPKTVPVVPPYDGLEKVSTLLLMFNDEGEVTVLIGNEIALLPAQISRLFARLIRADVVALVIVPTVKLNNLLLEGISADGVTVGLVVEGAFTSYTRLY